MMYAKSHEGLIKAGNCLFIEWNPPKPPLSGWMSLFLVTFRKAGLGIFKCNIEGALKSWFFPTWALDERPVVLGLVGAHAHVEGWLGAGGQAG